MSDSSQGPDWWMGTDGKWYPPRLPAPPPNQSPTSEKGPATDSQPPPPTGNGGPRNQRTREILATAGNATGHESGSWAQRNPGAAALILVIVLGIGIVIYGLANGAVDLNLGGTPVSSTTTVAGAADSPQAKAFFAAVFADRNFDVIDATAVSDETLIAGGREFCSDLDASKTASTDAFAEHPTPEDFAVIAESLARSRFKDAKPIEAGRSVENAQIVLSYTVGIAAVKNLCPTFTPALG